MSMCVNTKRSVVLTSDNRHLTYWSPEKGCLARHPLPSGTTTDMLHYDSVFDAVICVRDSHRLLVLKARDFTPAALPKASEDAILCMAHSTSRRLLVTGHAKGLITVWRLVEIQTIRTMRSNTGQEFPYRVTATQLLESPGMSSGHWVTALTVTEDNGPLEWAIAAIANGVDIWDLRTSTLIMRFTVLHDTRIVSVAFDVESQYLATADANRLIRIWDMKNDVVESTMAGASSTPTRGVNPNASSSNVNSESTS